MKKIFRTLSVLACICFLCVTPTFAASKAKTAKNAFAKAIINGKIYIDNNAYSAISDANRDGYPELILLQKPRGKWDTYLFIYQYKKGKVKQIVKFWPEYSIYYNGSGRKFCMVGEGDGGWRIDYRLKASRMVEIDRYSGYSSKNGSEYYRIIKGQKTPISQAAYLDKFFGSSKGNILKKRSKKALIKLLKK